MVEVKDAFQNVPYVEPVAQPGGQPTAYASQFQNLQELRIGAGPTSFSVDKSGWWMGANRFADAPAKCDMLGNAAFNSVLINGRSGSVIASAIDADGNFVNQLLSSNFNTQTKLILGEFQFQGSGALKIATDANNGVWISPTGILGKKAGATTFAIDNGGNATFGGTLVAASGTFGSITAGSFSGVSITASTITGNTIKANGGGGVDVWLENTGYLKFRYGDSDKAYIASDASGNLIIDADNAIYITADGAGDDIVLHAGDVLALYANNGFQLWFNKDGGSDVIGFVSGAGATVVGTLNGNGDFAVSGDIQCGDTFKSSDGSSGQNISHDFVTSVFYDSGVLKRRQRTYTFKDGILTNVSPESTYTV
jgi:hypothetical protein